MDEASLRILIFTQIDDESHRCHGDNDPVKAGRDGSEPRALVNLDEVAEAGKEIKTDFDFDFEILKPGEDEAADGDEEDEEEELLEAVLQRVGNRLEARRMPRKGTDL